MQNRRWLQLTEKMYLMLNLGIKPNLIYKNKDFKEQRKNSKVGGKN